MKRNVTAAGAVLVATLLAGVTQAAPIHFDFTGTLTSSGYSYPPIDGLPTTIDGYAFGEAISGGFDFETDRLYDAGIQGAQHDWVDWQPTNLTSPLAFLNFGGRSVAFPVYPAGSNYSMITFVDGCSPTACPAGWADGFHLFASSTDQEFPGDFTGTLHRNGLIVGSTGTGDSRDSFDGATVDPLAILSLSLSSMYGIYSEETISCVSGACAFHQVNFNFDIDSVSRGFGTSTSASTSVPEPGTLGLLGVATLAALFLGRRRKLTSALLRPPRARRSRT